MSDDTLDEYYRSKAFKEALTHKPATSIDDLVVSRQDGSMLGNNYVMDERRLSFITLRALERKCPLDDHHIRAYSSPPASASLGTLGTLPAELCSHILVLLDLDLDLQSVTPLAATSQATRAAINSLPGYKTIRTIS